MGEKMIKETHKLERCWSLSCSQEGSRARAVRGEVRKRNRTSQRSVSISLERAQLPNSSSTRREKAEGEDDKLTSA